MTYFVKRFDRDKLDTKYSAEDFAQLNSASRDTKYNGSIENQIIPIIEKFCTFPVIEKVKVFKLILFNFLVGNEDMHLKNYSLITKKGKTTLSPVYDLLNTTIVQRNTKEESALPLNGKKNNLTRKDLFNYLANERLHLSSSVL